MIEIINKPLLLYLVGYLYYWQMGFNSVFKGLNELHVVPLIISLLLSFYPSRFMLYCYPFSHFITIQ